MRRPAKNLTELDKFYLDRIRFYGFVSADSDGSTGVEGNFPFPRDRLMRLIQLGMVEGAKDGLFDGCSQTYKVKEGV